MSNIIISADIILKINFIVQHKIFCESSYMCVAIKEGLLSDAMESILQIFYRKMDMKGSALLPKSTSYEVFTTVMATCATAL